MDGRRPDPGPAHRTRLTGRLVPLGLRETPGQRHHKPPDQGFRPFWSSRLEPSGVVCSHAGPSMEVGFSWLDRPQSTRQGHPLEPLQVEQRCSQQQQQPPEGTADTAGEEVTGRPSSICPSSPARTSAAAITAPSCAPGHQCPFRPMHRTAPLRSWSVASGAAGGALPTCTAASALRGCVPATRSGGRPRAPGRQVF
jgi:hypothetical protein